MGKPILLASCSDQDKRFVLDKSELRIGSDKHCDIFLPEITVSRQHAVLARQGQDWILTDLQSSNGVFVNDARISEPTLIAAADTIRFGNCVARFLDEDPAETELAIPAESLHSQHAAVSQHADQKRTVSADRLEQFFSHTLPQVLKSCVDVPVENRPALLLQVLPEVITGKWTLLRNDAVVGSAGKSASEKPPHTYSLDKWQLTVQPDKTLSAHTLDKLGESILAILILLHQSENPAKPHQTAVHSRDDWPAPRTQYGPLQHLYRQAAQVARGDINILIEGDSGTGKELFAQYLHRCGDADQPLVTLNCASLPQDLLDAELFGIEKGVATGVSARAGKFEQADGGVLFLDEIGDMHQATQAKLLRVLQEQRVYRIGGSEPRPAKVRVISATNKNLDAMVEKGEFRLDLFHRIADWQLRLPNLKERIIDIANLAAFFLKNACQQSGRQFGGISQAALQCLQQHPWPGNIRELEREMKRCALFLDPGEALRSEHLQQRIRQHSDQIGNASVTTGLKAVLENTERQTIEQALRNCEGDVAQAAEVLKIGKSTLYRQMKKLRISA